MLNFECTAFGIVLLEMQVVRFYVPTEKARERSKFAAGCDCIQTKIFSWFAGFAQLLLIQWLWRDGQEMHLEVNLANFFL